MEFEDIYKRYYKDVYYFLLSMSSNPELSEELTQETFYRAFKNIHKFKRECKLSSWLCQIGKNTYLSWVKKQKHLVGMPPDAEGSAEAEVKEGDGRNTPETLCIRREEALSVYKVLHLLQEPYKEVFTLKTLGELSYREIGEIFGKGEGWARVTYHRAKLKIQERIKEAL